jgi:transposase InsO family protein
MIAFMDDATRFIVGWALIPDKTAATCAGVLAGILGTDIRPCVLGSDNGGEFKGDIFLHLLEQAGIATWYTRPCTPQQNGKIERFWQTMEHTTKDTSDPNQISDFIQWYHRWPHGGTGIAPNYARSTILSWAQVSSHEISRIISENLTWDDDL